MAYYAYFWSTDMINLKTVLEDYGNVKNFLTKDSRVMSKFQM